MFIVDRLFFQVTKLKKGEILMISVGSTCVGCNVVQVKPEKAKVELFRPVCTRVSSSPVIIRCRSRIQRTYVLPLCQSGDKVALSRRFDKHWRLIGWGEIIKGKIIEPTYN